MVFLALADLGLKTTVFAVETLWNVGVWAIYGKQKPRQEQLLEEISKHQERESQLLEKLTQLEERKHKAAQKRQKEIQEIKQLITKSNVGALSEALSETVAEDPELPNWE